MFSLRGQQSVGTEGPENLSSVPQLVCGGVNTEGSYKAGPDQSEQMYNVLQVESLVFDKRETVSLLGLLSKCFLKVILK